MRHPQKSDYLVITGILLFVCTTCETSWSHGGPPPEPAMIIENWDKDGDGMIGADEFRGPRQHFTFMDTDADGYLTVDELEAGRPGPPCGPGGFDMDDIDNDAMVSAEEFSGPADLFQRLDADGDGYITRDEARPDRAMGRPGPPPQDNELN